MQAVISNPLHPISQFTKEVLLSPRDAFGSKNLKKRNYHHHHHQQKAGRGNQPKVPSSKWDTNSSKFLARRYQQLVAKLELLAARSKARDQKKTTTGTTTGSDLYHQLDANEYQRLVEELFVAHGADLQAKAAIQQQVLCNLNLQPKNAGSTNINERGQVIHNSCFYLSLAASYLSGIGALMQETSSTTYHEEYCRCDGYDIASTSLFGREDQVLIRGTALQFKRQIEDAVVRAHPEWVSTGMVGEEVQAYSDFLVCLMEQNKRGKTQSSSSSLVNELAVVVFDATSGICDVYKGKQYNQSPENCITIQCKAGHYEPLIPTVTTTTARQERPNLQQILDQLDANDILYVVTDGATA